MHYTVLHIPHASTRIPEGERAAYIVPPAALERELLRFTDRFTDELYAVETPLAKPLVYGVSRLVVDPERFADDAIEPMAQRGLGAVYVKTLDGARLRSDPTPEERRALLERYYDPHHRKAASLIRQALGAHAGALVLDCHSYPTEPHPYEDPARPRPEVCLGTDDFHTPDWLFDAAFRVFRDAGFSVERNHPFSGAFVPAPYHDKEKAVLALMIELRRGTYMDEDSGGKLSDFEPLRARLQRSLVQIIVRAKERAHG